MPVAAHARHRVICERQAAISLPMRKGMDVKPIPQINLLMRAFELGIAERRRETPLAHVVLDRLAPDAELNLAFQLGYNFVKPEQAAACHMQVNGTEAGDVRWTMIDPTTGKGTTATMSRDQFLRIMEYLDLCRQEMVTSV
jgi:hypothetical protein